ncbi:MAG TPA: class I SAM-dependent methyltransferase [Gemmatimonadales bacterium]|nr:class I SAM-dependent methyltransferase [Gemmatimonadales bacterium]
MASEVTAPAERTAPGSRSGPLGLPACRFCSTPLTHTFVDLGMSPLCESFLAAEQLDRMEPFYPLHVRVCDRCWLVQLEAYVGGEEIFTDYAYFSSFSTSWLAHAERYTDAMIQRFGLGPKSYVVELASNDGYLLQYFVARKVPCLGIEPAANVAQVAEAKGVPTLVKFFGVETARELVRQGRRADLLLGNNVLAQVPDLNDFVGGMKVLLAPTGVITIEFPHLLKLVAENQFDTIYHEHYSYFSLLTAEKIFAAHGLTLFDVEELSTHGGSLRIYGRHQEDTSKPVGARVEALRAREQRAGVDTVPYYQSFGAQVEETKRALLDFLIDAKRQGKRIVGYGAPGKGNTLLNYCGVGRDFLDFTVDRNPHKHGKYLPGTHIPILQPEAIADARPDYILILPWNLKDEIATQLAYVREWGGRCVVPIPTTQILS